MADITDKLSNLSVKDQGDKQQPQQTWAATERPTYVPPHARKFGETPKYNSGCVMIFDI